MAIYKNNKKVIGVYRGTSPVLKIYKGSSLVFGGSSSSSSTIFRYKGEKNGTISLNLDNNSVSTQMEISTDWKSYDMQTPPTSMNKMFSDNPEITEIDLSSFDASNVTNMGSLFSGCTSLTTLYLGNIDISKVTNATAMFSNCNSLNKIKCSSTVKDWILNGRYSNMMMFPNNVKENITWEIV